MKDIIYQISEDMYKNIKYTRDKDGSNVELTDEEVVEYLNAINNFRGRIVQVNLI